METKGKKRRHALGKWVVGIIPLLLGVLYIFPVLMLVSNTFKPLGDIVKNFLALPTSLYLDNIRQAASILQYWLAFRNSAIITVSVVIASTLLSFMCAYGSSHLWRRFSRGVYLLFVLGQMVPFYAIMVPVYIMASRMKLTDTFYGLILFGAGGNVAFGMVMYTGFLKSVSRELEEAAEIDGSGIFSTMFRIVFPLVAPTTATVAVLFFLWTWNDFLFPSLMLSSASRRTLMINIAYFKTTTSTRWDLMIAGLMLCMLPVAAVYLAAQKYVVGGITAGSIK